jgi:nucleotide-binding universal stress UspA family protein
MSDLDRLRTERQARDRSGDRATTRYGDAINRYLGATGYRETCSVDREEMAAEENTRPYGVVLAGVDETPTSYTAVDHAAIEAELRGWDLRLLHVQRGGGALYPTRDAGARLLQRVTDRVHAYSPSVAVTSRLAVGAAAPLLISDAHDVSLLVVGHRHSAAGRAFGLSVGDRVAAHHTGPVLVVRVPGWPPGPDFGARPIVAGVDGAVATKQVIDFAVAEARVRGSEVILLHATGGDRTLEDRVDDVDGVVVHRRFLPGDAQAAMIAASGTAAAVVVGRRGPGGFAGSLLGSVSRAMVRHAHCPVFLLG